MILHTGKILLPKKDCDMSKWAVVACDQYTSQADYWRRVETLTQNVPSSYHLILPEIYLENADLSQRIAKIYENMTTTQFDSYENAMVLVERTLADGKVRRGVVLTVDLECYSYEVGAHSLVRPTEKTVVDRIPPRAAVRKNATMELPHIMLLIDNPEKDIIEPLFTVKRETLYDFNLMEQGGSIKGYLLNDPVETAKLCAQVEALCDPTAFRKKYKLKEDLPVLPIAVGDGNHSMATAKAHWERIKKTLSPDQKETHPARFVLAELGNIHDSGNEIEPIHRVAFAVKGETFLQSALSFYKNQGCTAFLASAKSRKGHCFPYITGEESGYLVVEDPIWPIPMATLQSYLDAYEAASITGLRVDYIHGEDVVATLAAKKGNVGFILPDIEKSEIFRGVILGGVLPKKTFSMGHAHDKRFYIEAKSIV